MNKQELTSSELLLDIGISVAVRPLNFLNRKIPFRRIVLRRPHLGGIIAICRYRAMMGISAEGFKALEVDKRLDFVAKNGLLMSLLVACTICRSWLSYHLFRRIVAWWLRWRVHPDVLGELMLITLSQTDTTPFQTIISSAEAMNVLRPRLSH
ncbi:MAG: hypothetical protein WCS17_12800 [Prevotella sp.]